MTKYPIHHFITVAIILLLSLSPSTSRCQSLSNGGFEKGTRHLPDGWYPTYTDWLRKTLEYVEFKWDDQVKHSGNRSVSLEVFKGHPPYTIAYNWTAPIEGFEIGKTYELTVWIRTERLKESTFVAIQCWGKKPKERKNLPGDDDPGAAQFPWKDAVRPKPGLENLINMFMASPQLKGTRDWTQVSRRFKVPKGTVELRVRMGIGTHYNNSGKVWFDDVEIKEVKKDR